MKTPICDFVKEYVNKKAVRLHMPGHKGIKALGPEALDITEIKGADVLYGASGIINQSEENCAKLFGTGKTFYSTEGSSLSIKAAVYLIKLFANEKGKKPLVLAARNVHKSFVSALALTDTKVNWFFGSGEGFLSCELDLTMLEKTIKKVEPTAFYLTSPDYLGNMADIEKIAGICHKYGTVLMVDNAHGAYLKFLKKSLHPIDLGADICIDSAHKTLPVLTGGAYLHFSKNADGFFAENARTALSLFASTSPSYLILQSLDLANDFLENSIEEKLSDVEEKISAAKIQLEKIGYTLLKGEPLKISISAKEYGYTGEKLGQLLENNGIYPEFYDKDFLVLMFSGENKKSDITKLVSLLSDVPKKEKIHKKPPILNKPIAKMSPKKAISLPFEKVAVKNARGRVLASVSVSCPPAVPILVCGERVDQNAISLFEYYGIKEILVVK